MNLFHIHYFRFYYIKSKHKYDSCLRLCLASRNDGRNIMCYNLASISPFTLIRVQFDGFKTSH